MQDNEIPNYGRIHIYCIIVSKRQRIFLKLHPVEDDFFTKSPILAPAPPFSHYSPIRKLVIT